jgi:hypothetical protein
MALEGDDLCLRWVVHTKEEEEEEEEEVCDSRGRLNPAFCDEVKNDDRQENNLAKFGYTLGMKVDKIEQNLSIFFLGYLLELIIKIW